MRKAGAAAKQFTYHASRFTHHASRFTFHASRFTHHASRFTHHASRFTFHASRFLGSLFQRLTARAHSPGVLILRSCGRQRAGTRIVFAFSARASSCNENLPSSICFVTAANASRRSRNGRPTVSSERTNRYLFPSPKRRCTARRSAAVT